MTDAKQKRSFTLFVEPLSFANNATFNMLGPVKMSTQPSIQVSPSTPPDLLTDEPENIGTYDGVTIAVDVKLYIPLIIPVDVGVMGEDATLVLVGVGVDVSPDAMTAITGR